ncbi:GNAT superfamily N-acetyltransferase [Desulfohalotomaculum tongense]|uniref:GNAT family N-acetyltransferase n=1 Tax=Desulforadius tongensis TaxID=1216062 RepID=UPI00195BEADA|nr:GNAT superfamily N-acetyltransferase [Desulforadius tongensis]
MTVKAFEVSNRRELDIFIRMPGVIYYDDPLWTPPSPHQVLNKLMQISPQDLILLVAVENNSVVGRVAGMINRRQQEKDTALFGYFECVNNEQAAKELFKELELWAVKKGYRCLSGPVSCNTNDSIGLLVEGFNLPPKNGMPYNPYYYSHLLEKCGFKKQLDLLAYHWTNRHPVPEKLARIAKKVYQTKGLVLRPINLANIYREAQLLSVIHNETMQDNWGAERLSVTDAAQYLSNYRSFADPELLLAVEINGEPAGVCLTLPEQHSQSCRVAVLAVVPKYRKRGVAALLMYETMLRVQRRGYKEAELSLIMESNTMMNRILQNTFNFKVSKRFRLYNKQLEAQQLCSNLS